MKSPFPGMDPYLEAHWGDVHSRLAIYASNQLNRQLPSGLRARVEEQLMVESSKGEEFLAHRFTPDVSLEESPAKRSRNGKASNLTPAVPVLLPRVAEPRIQRSVHIREGKGEGRLVTSIEIVSPANKTSLGGRQAYRLKQARLLDGGASLVEIDLIRAGKSVVAALSQLIKKLPNAAYRVCVVRAWEATQSEVYAISIRKPLPVISIPLRSSDPDALLDLQAILEMAYEDGLYEDCDYTRNPPPPRLNSEDAAWVDKLLTKAGLR